MAIYEKQIMRKTADLKKKNFIGFELIDPNNLNNSQTFVFSINPSDITVDEPARVTVTQTPGGGHIDDFGEGIPTFTISGTTGYKKRLAVTNFSGKMEYVDGYTEFKKLRDIYRKYLQVRKEYAREVDGTRDPQTVELIYRNIGDEDHWRIQPIGFTLQRSRQDPLQYRYTFKFYGVDDFRGGGSQQDRLQKALNRGKSRLNAVVNSYGRQLGRLRDVFDKGQKTKAYDSKSTNIVGSVIGGAAGVMDSVSNFVNGNSKKLDTTNVKNATADINKAVGTPTSTSNDTGIGGMIAAVGQAATSLIQSDTLQTATGKSVIYETVDSIRQIKCLLSTIDKQKDILLQAWEDIVNVFNEQSGCGSTLNLEAPLQPYLGQAGARAASDVYAITTLFRG